MKRHMALAAVVVSTMVAAGCTTNERTLGGAAVGGVGGAVVGGAIAGSGGAVVGGVGGAATGAIVGRNL